MVWHKVVLRHLFCRLNPYVFEPFILHLLVKGLGDHNVGRLVSKCGLTQQVNVGHQMGSFLFVDKLPVIDVPFLGRKLWLVDPLNQLESVFAVAHKEEELVLHQKGFLNRLLLEVPLYHYSVRRHALQIGLAVFIPLFHYFFTYCFVHQL